MRAAISFSLCLMLQACSLPAQPERPNIILVMTDDLGWGDVGFNGNTVIKTPNLDSLAARGIIMNRFYTASPVCSPTRFSVLTGRNPMRAGILTANSGHLSEDEITLAELLHEAGYATGHFGKWHLGTLTTSIRDSNRGRPGDSTHFSIPTQHGFDEYFSTEAKVPTFDPMIKPVEFDTLRGESLRYGWASVQPGQNAETYGTHYWTTPDAPESENLSGDNSKVILDRVLPFIDRSRAGEQPFFAVVWFHTPHLPVVTDSSNRALYSGYSHDEQLYYGAISAMDEQVGRLWHHLVENGLADDTMLWFSSDNGPEIRTPGSSGPYRERKRSLFEGGVRVPAFVVWPDRLQGGKRISVPAVTSDYLPTIVEYLGLQYPQNRTQDGISLVHILDGAQPTRDHPIGFYFQEKRSWVDDTYKLISVDEGETFELYNVVRDPQEHVDISAEQPDRVTRMEEELNAWLDDLVD